LDFPGFDKPWFLTEGKLLLYSSYLPLGVPNWMVIHINRAATSSSSQDLNMKHMEEKTTI
jgi:hypothetical protein